MKWYCMEKLKPQSMVVCVNVYKGQVKLKKAEK